MTYLMDIFKIETNQDNRDIFIKFDKHVSNIVISKKNLILLTQI